MKTIAVAVAILSACLEVSGDVLSATEKTQEKKVLDLLEAARDRQSLDWLEGVVETTSSTFEGLDKEAAKDGASDEAKTAAAQAKKIYQAAVQAMEAKMLQEGQLYHEADEEDMEDKKWRMQNAGMLSAEDKAQKKEAEKDDEGGGEEGAEEGEEEGGEEGGEEDEEEGGEEGEEEGGESDGEEDGDERDEN